MRRPAPLSRSCSDSNNNNNTLPRPGSLSRSNSNNNNTLPRPGSLSRSNSNNNNTLPRPGSLSRSINVTSDIFASGDNHDISPNSHPSLLQDIRLDLGTKLQTPWNVSDNSLRPVPMFYPPLDPRCTCIITDSSPSVVAFRISDCLKRRSISVEYDDEMITASCMTIDRVHFSVNLYRGNRRTSTSDFTPDLAHAIIVEIVRIRGSPISFHPHNRSILNAAMGQSSGEETRNPTHTGPCEFPRFVSKSKIEEQQQQQQSKRRAQTTMDLLPLALERVLSLLTKDRIDVQRLGMESLVTLTDCHSSGVELAVLSSMVVIGAPVMTGNDGEGEVNGSEEIHRFIVCLLQDRILPEESKGEATVDGVDSSVTDQNSQNEEQQELPANPLFVNDAYHGGLMRSMALRVLSNALTVLSQHQPELLSNLLEASKLLTSREFVQALAEDLVGGTRLPAVVAGTRLASAHEAALATRCMGILAENSLVVQRLVANPKAAEHPTLDILSKNFETIRHDALEVESRKAYELLSRDIRTC